MRAVGDVMEARALNKLVARLSLVEEAETGEGGEVAGRPSA